jgi:hypothetical protein
MIGLLWLVACGEPPCGPGEVAVWTGNKETCEIGCAGTDTGIGAEPTCPDGLACVASGSSCRTCKDIVSHCQVP